VSIPGPSMPSALVRGAEASRGDIALFSQGGEIITDQIDQ